MAKQRFYKQPSIDETLYPLKNYEDDHYDEFYNLLFNGYYSKLSHATE